MTMLPTRLSLALPLALLAAPALAQEVQYELTNDSGLTLMEFYAGPAGEGGGGDDLLGANVLASGEVGTVAIPDDTLCDRDLRFVFEDGSERVETTNICDEAGFTLAAQ
jgi:hypothetical protein